MYVYVCIYLCICTNPLCICTCICNVYILTLYVYVYVYVDSYLRRESHNPMLTTQATQLIIYYDYLQVYQEIAL
jgi:hypothetical protein